MFHYQVQSYLDQISSLIDRLGLPLSDCDCVIASDSRNALRLDIISAIEYLYDRSLIDSLQKDEFLTSLSASFIYGGM